MKRPALAIAQDLMELIEEMEPRHRKLIRLISELRHSDIEGLAGNDEHVAEIKKVLDSFKLYRLDS